MNIRQTLDNLKKPFEKGQKLEKLYPAFDAFETFLFVPKKYPNLLATDSKYALLSAISL